MSRLVKSNPGLDLLNVNPMSLSVMAFSVLVAFCIDCADMVTAHDALRVFPVKNVEKS